MGLALCAKAGNKLKKAVLPYEIHAAPPESLAQARDELQGAFRIVREKVKRLPLFYGTIR